MQEARYDEIRLHGFICRTRCQRNRADTEKKYNLLFDENLYFLAELKTFLLLTIFIDIHR